MPKCPQRRPVSPASRPLRSHLTRPRPSGQQDGGVGCSSCDVLVRFRPCVGRKDSGGCKMAVHFQFKTGGRRVISKVLSILRCGLTRSMEDG